MSDSSLVPSSPEPMPLPCPFCGETPAIDRGSTPHPVMPTIWPTVYCVTKTCIVKPAVESRVLADAIAAWNRRSSVSSGSPETQEREAVVATFGRRITELESQRSSLREKIRGLRTIAHRHPGDTPEHPTRYVPLDDVLRLIGWDVAALERDAGEPVEQILAETRERLSASLREEGPPTPDPLWNAYVEAWLNGEQSGSADPMMGYEQRRAKAESEANRYIAARVQGEKQP